MPLKTKKSLTSSTKVPPVRLNDFSTLFRVVSWRLDRTLRMKSPLRASCTNKRADPCPGLASRFPSAYTFLCALPYCRGEIPGQLPARRLGADLMLFSFRDPDLGAAVPAFHIIIRIPALDRCRESCFYLWCGIHKPPPTLGAVDRPPMVYQNIAFILLLLSACHRYTPFHQRRSCCREYMTSYAYRAIPQYP